MTMIPLVSGSAEATASTIGAAVLGYGETTNAGIVNAVSWTPTITTLERDAWRATAKKAGFRLWLDLGAGLEEIPLSEIGIDVTLEEHRSAYSDSLRFQLIGEKYNPLDLDVMRGSRPVRFDVGYGRAGKPYWITRLQGYTSHVEWSVWPPVLTVTCQDVAVKVGEKLLGDYNLPPNSGRTRISILYEFLGILGLTPGRIVGVTGTVNKPVNPGEQRALDFIRDWLTPTRAEMNLRGNVFNCEPYDPATAPIAKTLRISDLGLPMTVAIPGTSEATTARTVAVKFAQQANGYRTETRIETRYADFSPATAAQTQSSADGVLYPSGYAAPPATYQKIAETIIAETYFGGTLVRSQIDEYEWFAPQIARMQLNGPAYGGAEGDITWNHDAPAYLFPDGTWRAIPQETWRLVRRTITERELDAAQSYVVKETERKWFYHWLQRAVGVIGAGGVEQLLGETIYLTENGDGVLFAQEIIGFPVTSPLLAPDNPPATYIVRPDAVRTVEKTIDANGIVQVETETALAYSPGLDRAKTQADTYVYGTATKRYKSRQAETWAGAPDPYGSTSTRTTTYRAITGRSDRLSMSIVDAPFGQTPVTSIGSSTPQRAEAVTYESQSQEMSGEVTDPVRAALNGSRTDPANNEYCENESELRAVSLEKIRALGGMPTSWSMPLEGMLAKESTIDFDLPGHVMDGKRVRITDVVRSWASYTQQVTGIHYPPELS